MSAYPSVLEAYSAGTDLLSLVRSGGIGTNLPKAGKAEWVVQGYLFSLTFGEPAITQAAGPYGCDPDCDCDQDQLLVATAIQSIMAEVNQHVYGNDIIKTVDQLRKLLVAFLTYIYPLLFHKEFEDK